MEMKPRIIFEYNKDERSYRLDIPHGAPLGECYDACFAFLEKLFDKIRENTEKTKPQQPVEEKGNDEEENS